MLTRRSVVLASMGAAVRAQQAEDPPFTLPAGVEHTAGIVYERRGARELKLDLFRPKAGRDRAAGIVYLHGGAWRGGGPRQFWRHAARMAEKGYVGASIQYRLSGEAKWPAAFDDARAAVLWLRANGAVDPGRIGAAGGSAGGHLASLLGVHGEVRSVAAFNPVLDFPPLAAAGERTANTAISDFLGVSYKENPELWKIASPASHVSKRSAAHLFLHGTKDATVPYRQSAEMKQRLEESGVRSELFTADGASHGFFNRPPWFAPALERMEQWFLETLR